MSRFIRSARGELIDFELLAIKAQLAAAPAPKEVDERKTAIDVKDGVKTTVAPDLSNEMLQIAAEGAAVSANAVATGKQIAKK
jgi:hypothetical protein